ncbi:isoliquiritigenin 2'-O-methyltransferase-like [Senna tora]|uniref:Isoliquiritigenin 2'-O-methyltransferase-like n=1 Tax=Senna tora TaxID=362788 RepID=A0A834SWQ6_9FABA|nr:isoliquiritigenin 2'-O-methyltransferase-like [Senna tora]
MAHALQHITSYIAINSKLIYTLALFKYSSKNNMGSLDNNTILPINPVMMKPPTKEEDDEACLYAMLLSSFQVFPAILNAAIELNVFEIMAESGGRRGSGGFLSVPEIASRLPASHPELHDRLDRMLRVLACFKVVDCTTRVVAGDGGEVERVYSLTLAGSYFLQNQSESLAAFSNLTCHPATVKVWLNMKEAILDGGVDLFNKVHGISMWKHMEKDTKLNQTFNKAMAGISAIQMRKYLEVYDGFEGVSTLVDVAGGVGQSLKMIISKYPNIKKGINYDLPQVIEHASPYPGIEHIGGNMYESVPEGDAIMVKATCHNWSDEKCVVLLKNCHKAIPQNGKVIIFDMIMPEEPESSVAAQYVSITDNTMFIQAGGKERSEKQFEKLCKDSGFSSFRVVSRALSIYGVIEFYK